MTTKAATLPTLQVFLQNLGIPWYMDMLSEAGITDVDSLIFDFDADKTRQLLTEAGVSDRDCESIVSELVKLAPKGLSMALNADLAASTPTSATMTLGGIYSEQFLQMALPLYDMHMGAENIGPLLYNLVRFTKPRSVLEVGAGYTSLFLLQALADNEAEMRVYAGLRERGEDNIKPGTPWCVEPYFQQQQPAPRLHCIDNMAHDFSTADKVSSVAERLGLRDFLVYHNSDAFDADLPALLAPGVQFDLLWVDLGAGSRIGPFVEAWWPRISAAGGMLAVHSTLTNSLTRSWLEQMRSRSRQSVPDPLYGVFETMSLLEPHKLFQNSVSVFKRRGDGLTDYEEPIYSKYP
eukprot:TRINITY_DN3094_c0_g1_i1.p1 TRINITY_DN3094_c0_g1~~TRINITY_DN3094_c0_g1_i1.p1  ORF type:complete len:363 (+),score=43.72 TRINITY_DN3094_c0_g1_i1:42-1091(+)